MVGQLVYYLILRKWVFGSEEAQMNLELIVADLTLGTVFELSGLQHYLFI